jgi:hypothetical protein
VLKASTTKISIKRPNASKKGKPVQGKEARRKS